jgi:crotonobetainyl-CoA:carnitine CoA-transferase CaiB-like acyl-CoA transferase
MMNASRGPASLAASMAERARASGAPVEGGERARVQRGDGEPTSAAGAAAGRSGVLTGVRVLDLTNVLAGPFCAYQLGLLGADVIKVEVPASGDLARQLGADRVLNEQLMGASFLAQNGGKKSITVNLKSDDGKSVFRRLVETSDVLVENFRPGVMKRLGLDFESLQLTNPRLIYCAISGFGQEGPMKDAPAYDQIIQGLSGMMSITGDDQSAPLRVGYPVADTIGGLTAALAITSALVGRKTSGDGTFIDVSMLDSVLATMGWVVSNYLIAGQEPQPMGNANFTAAPSGTFRTGDGLLNIAANKQEQFEALATAIGRRDLINDQRFAARESRKNYRRELTTELESGLAGKSAADWETLLNQQGIPAGRVLTVPEALQSPQIRHRQLLQQVDSVPGIGRPVMLTRAGFTMSIGQPGVTSPPPSLGEHTAEILADLGYDAAEIGRLERAGAV